MLPAACSDLGREGDFRYTIDRNTCSVFVFADSVMSSTCATNGMAPAGMNPLEESPYRLSGPRKVIEVIDK